MSSFQSILTDASFGRCLLLFRSFPFALSGEREEEIEGEGWRERLDSEKRV